MVEKIGRELSQCRVGLQNPRGLLVRAGFCCFLTYIHIIYIHVNKQPVDCQVSGPPSAEVERAQ